MSKKRKRDRQAARDLLSSQATERALIKPSDELAAVDRAHASIREGIALDGSDSRTLLVAGGVLAVVFLWSYWPTLAYLAHRWNVVADYSHGFLVPPLAIGFLWFRRARFPHGARGVGWAALVLLGLALAMRITGARCFLPAFDGWSIPLWLGSICLLFGGWRLLWWCLPSLGFLLFMVPLPYRVEGMLRVPLQQVATMLSCMFLQCLGQPALQEGTSIILEEQELDVADACSGLRILMGIVALATAYVILVEKPWWQKALLLASVVPVAISANVLRITLTGLLFQYVSGEVSRGFSHNVAGWFTNCIAATFFAAVLWCMSRLFVETEIVDSGELLREAGDVTAT